MTSSPDTTSLASAVERAKPWRLYDVTVRWSDCEVYTEHFEKQAEIHRERAARFRAEAAGWSQCAPTSEDKGREDRAAPPSRTGTAGAPTV